MKISKNLTIVIISIIIFRVLLDICYNQYVGSRFAYLGMGLDIDAVRYSFSWVMLALVSSFYISNSNTVSGVVAFTLMMVGFVPLTSFYALAGANSYWLGMSGGFWVLVSIFSKLRLPTINVRRPETFVPMMSVVLVLAGIALSAIILKFGFSFGLSFDDVYEVRAENTLSSIPFGGYIVPWTARVALPALAVIGLWVKGWVGRWMIASALLLEFIFFSITGHKSFLFSIIMVLGFYRLAHSISWIKWVAISFVSIIVVCILIDNVKTDGYLSSLLVRRGLYVPAMLSNAYYEFFRDHYQYLSHSIFSAWLDNPLYVSPSIAVGEQYMGFKDLNANNGVVADGYMNFGMIGTLVWAAMVGLTIAVYEMLSRTVPIPIALPLGLNCFLTFLNSGFLTGLLTHGILLMFALLLLVPKTHNIHRFREKESGRGLQSARRSA